MKKFIISGLFFIPFLFQNCTVEIAGIDTVVSPNIEYHMASSDDSEESLSAFSKAKSPDDIPETSVNPI